MNFAHTSESANANLGVFRQERQVFTKLSLNMGKIHIRIAMCLNDQKRSKNKGHKNKKSKVKSIYIVKKSLKVQYLKCKCQIFHWDLYVKH